MGAGRVLACQSTPDASIANQPDAPAAKPATPRIKTVLLRGSSAQVTSDASASSAK